MVNAKHIATAGRVSPVNLADDDEGQGTTAVLDNLIRPLRRHLALPALHRDGGKVTIAQTSGAPASGLTVLYSPDRGVEIASLAGSSGNGGAATVTFGKTDSSFVINITWDASVSTAPAGFRSVVIATARYLESQFLDPVTINISIGFGEVNGTALEAGNSRRAAPTSTATATPPSAAPCPRTPHRPWTFRSSPPCRGRPR